jgi:hypothetical protein
MAPAPRDDADDRSSRNRLGSRFQDAWTHVVPYSNLGNNFAVTSCQSRFQDVAVERFLFLCLLILVSPDELYMYMHTNPEPRSPLRPAPCRFPFLLPPCVLVDIPCEHRKSRSDGDRTVTDKRPMCSASTGRQSPTPIHLGIAAASDRFDNSHGVSCELFLQFSCRVRSSSRLMPLQRRVNERERVRALNTEEGEVIKGEDDARRAYLALSLFRMESNVISKTRYAYRPSQHNRKRLPRSSTRARV